MNQAVTTSLTINDFISLGDHSETRPKVFSMALTLMQENMQKEPIRFQKPIVPHAIPTVLDIYHNEQKTLFGFVRYDGASDPYPAALQIFDLAITNGKNAFFARTPLPGDNKEGCQIHTTSVTSFDAWRKDMKLTPVG